MSSETRQREAVLYRAARNEVLLSEDPHHFIADHGMDVSLASVMHEVGDYIRASYTIDDNPLEYLRKSFPAFVWRFYEDGGRHELIQRARTSDYIWLQSFGSVIDGFVMATQVDRSFAPRLLCYKAPNANSDISRVSSELPGIRFVSFTCETESGTQIK